MLRFILMFLVVGFVSGFLAAAATDPDTVAYIGVSASQKLNNLIYFLAGGIMGAEALYLSRQKS